MDDVRWGPLLDERIDRRTRLLMLQGWRDRELDLAVAARPTDRLAPAFCMVGAAAGSILRSPLLLAALAATAVVGAATGRHPVERLHARLVGRTAGGTGLPAARAARRFACALAAVWLTATIVAYALGWTGVAVGLGFALAAVAGVYTTVGFCVPSTIFTLLLGAERATCPTLGSLHPRRAGVLGLPRGDEHDRDLRVRRIRARH